MSSAATIEGLNKRKSDLLERIDDELNLNENNLFEFSNLQLDQELPDSLEQEELLDKKKREREKLGSVNLKADEETSKYEIEIKKMEKDRSDLVSAISKLKESINELNLKGRERLLDAFEKVNRKFNEVYTKLFNGGSAKLELVDSDDPLNAGLEMLVSPPGKRLQSITLLSGGEQALTALSLIFAVFLTNPAPICVLDEVDAPLDDANVTRFCSLLDELVRITNIVENNQNINEKVIMVGFSSSSLFSARFTFLHPERVSVAVGGGIGGLLPVPADKINGIDAIYPIGTYDFEKITGKKFDLEEFKKTPQFYYQGTKDKSNPFRRGAEDLTDEEFEIVKKLFVDGLPFGDKPVSLKVNTKMWENSQKYINQIVDNVKFESPKNLDHEITPKMTSKSIKFIKENLN